MKKLIAVIAGAVLSLIPAGIAAAHIVPRPPKFH
jgi:hypothetical protein